MFILLLLMKLPALLHPMMPAVLPNHTLFSGIVRFIPLSALGFTIMALLLHFLQALYLNFLAERHKLYGKSGFFVALLYIILTSYYPGFQYFSDTLLINGLVLFAVDILLGLPKTPHAAQKLYNAGFVISLPVMINFPTIGFFLLFIIGYLLFRSFKGKELLIGLLGYGMPFYFLAGILYLTDQTILLKNPLEFKYTWQLISGSRLYLIGVITGLSVMFLAAVYSFLQTTDKIVIYVRRSWFFLFIYGAITVPIALLTVTKAHSEWLLLFPPLSLIIGLVFYHDNNKRMSTFILYFSLALLIFCHFTNKYIFIPS